MRFLGLFFWRIRKQRSLLSSAKIVRVLAIQILRSLVYIPYVLRQVKKVFLNLVRHPLQMNRKEGLRSKLNYDVHVTTVHIP
jgi:hypothetical protein